MSETRYQQLSPSSVSFPRPEDLKPRVGIRMSLPFKNSLLKRLYILEQELRRKAKCAGPPYRLSNPYLRDGQGGPAMVESLRSHLWAKGWDASYNEGGFFNADHWILKRRGER